MANKKISLDSLYLHRRKDWYDHPEIDMDSAKVRHRANVERLKRFEEERKNPDRPLYICVIHGSGRHIKESCAYEMSNSEMLLERSIELAEQEWEGKDLDFHRISLREKILEPCNACYSTASALCNWPCSCFPGDDITTEIYPAIFKADVLLFSTPVNQASCSSRLKILLDRLISMDGGYFMEELPYKDAKFREAAIEVSKRGVTYDPRMFGKVAAYFVTTKDYANPLEESAPYPKEFKGLDYKDTTIGMLATQGTEYGWFHADPFYTVAVANHDREMSYDKTDYDLDIKTHQKGKETVTAALKLGESHFNSPPKLTSLGRINRT